MWAVIGLGNPGRKYARTRHNAGFMAIGRLSESYGGRRADKAGYLALITEICGQGVVLAMPLEYMNLSGHAVSDIQRKYKIGPESTIVIHDDIDIDAGRIKIKLGGSSAGHKGVQSIISETGSKDFIRVKIGVGKDPSMPAEQYVLERLTYDELKVIHESADEACKAVEAIISEGAEQAMNKFNIKQPKDG